MEWAGLNELRERFLSFFEAKNHVRMSSFSLVPENDNSLLLINSGMAPLKGYFLGQQKCATNRMTDCQKCIRTPDIDRVGQTSRHGTFFEMLGNFSFGDYSKREAILWAFEFVTQELKMPIKQLYISVYEHDDEAKEIWINEVGIPADHIIKLGKDDNFWEIGTGPCGPCTELYFDRGEQFGCGNKHCQPGCDCDRFVEFWNIVFSELNSDGKGNYTELEQKNIDTGMGLERIACIAQKVDNLFEVDSIKNIVDAVCVLTKKTYKAAAQDDVSIRVITDHIRSSVFLISDQVMPSNEGRGYVLRRLLRRAMRHGRKLGLVEPFLFQLCNEVITHGKGAYPELVENQQHIKNVIKNEELKFMETIDQGLSLLAEFVVTLRKNNEKVFPGDLAFKLYDTFGFPLEMVEEITAESGMILDHEGFNSLMAAQKSTARDARKKESSVGWSESTNNPFNNIPTTEFVGYSMLRVKTKILALAKDDRSIDSVSAGETCRLVVEKTPFYSTSGGQVGDIGQIVGETGRLLITNSCKENGQHVLTASVLEGGVSVGNEVECCVDEKRRESICKNHSACHILQKALQEVLGKHVAQAGSLVDDKRLRFDFAHFEAMSKEQLALVQKKVNDIIFACQEVQIREMPLEEAVKTGAMALFGEKYADMVRVCSIGNYSKELCGGTHVSNSAQIGIFKIISETSVAAGVRRIEAITGENVLDELDKTDERLLSIANTLKINGVKEIENRLTMIIAELKEAKGKVNELQAQQLAMVATEQAAQAKKLNSINIIIQVFSDLKLEAVRTLYDILRNKLPDCIFILVAGGEKNSILVGVSGKAMEKCRADELIKRLCTTLGGSGGGKKELAQGRIVNIANLEQEAMLILQSFNL
ncbi:MAG: alanine--tRNA ligase [Oscillospiraceae bacterium]|jgi:alanyl-tRNA synthetase|nr:alanine--tRNA ligase [Oscillospiraceae bacterium]